jgi:hypothetical protein
MFHLLKLLSFLFIRLEYADIAPDACSKPVEGLPDLNWIGRPQITRSEERGL